MRPLLGCFVEVGIVSQRHGESAHAAMDAAFAAIQHVNDSLSFHAADSELTRLNQAAGMSVAMSSTALRVLKLAQRVTLASGGVFNCTVGGALVAAGHLPDHGAGARLLVGDATDLVLDSKSARLRRPVLITLDGIAKGYAVDVAVAAMKRSGVLAGWVNGGGDLRVFGNYTLTVRARDSSSARGWGVRNSSLASSGGEHLDAGRFTGRLFDAMGNEVASPRVSVLASRAWRADALTKIAAATTGHYRQQLLMRLGGRLIDESTVQAA